MDDGLQVLLLGLGTRVATQAQGLGEHPYGGQGGLEFVGHAGYELGPEPGPFRLPLDVPPGEVCGEGRHKEDQGEEEAEEPPLHRSSLDRGGKVRWEGHPQLRERPAQRLSVQVVGREKSSSSSCLGHIRAVPLPTGQVALRANHHHEGWAGFPAVSDSHQPGLLSVGYPGDSPGGAFRGITLGYFGSISSAGRPAKRRKIAPELLQGP